MRKFALISFLIYVFAVTAQTDDKTAQAQQQIDNLIKALEKKEPTEPKIQWNRYETVNFEILSIDDTQGKFTYNNIEFIKTWILNRWDMRNIDFSNKCKVMIVPSKDLFIKLFNKEQSSFRFDPKGSAIWICTEEFRWLTDILPKMLTEVTLNEFEVKFNTKFGLWAHRGMAVLNGSIPEIKKSLSMNNDFILSKVMLNMTLEQYSKLSELNRIKFDAQCAGFCLMIRKEYGSKKFLDYLGESRNDSEKGLTGLGIGNYAGLDPLLFNYLNGLMADIKQQKTPNSYLIW